MHEDKETQRNERLEKINNSYLKTREILDNQIFKIITIFLGTSIFLSERILDIISTVNKGRYLIFISCCLLVLGLILTILSHLSVLEQCKQEYYSELDNELKESVKKVMEKAEFLSQISEIAIVCFLLSLLLILGVSLKIKLLKIIYIVIGTFITIYFIYYLYKIYLRNND